MSENSTVMPAGPPSDAQGRPAVDPTDNVLALVRASERRQDDLREMEAKYQRREVKAEAAHAKELRIIEKERLDAIRAVDVKKVDDAATVQATQASALAAQVATTAEANRAAVSDAAIANATSLRAEINPLQKDIAELRKSQYEGVGAKAQVVETRDSATDMRPILEAIAKLERTQSEGVGHRAQVVETQARSSNAGLWIGLGVAAFFGFTTLVLGVVSALLLRSP